ncbi:MAG TPA: transporter associated domain-containing protein [Steroidobacteraceae bacterium]|nr:transporter associated domain-containing protein [Steroidobacteraceae bacterium]
MEWLTDPTIWFGLLTLVVLEIVLGIDNLIFIAILANKLPPRLRDRARVLGLTVACLMRLALLASISWIMGLTAPLLTVASMELSWRDIILIGGGGFLLVKATLEMHDRLEAAPRAAAEVVAPGKFWPVVAQIVVLDAVFSIDSVLTAVGMVDELPVMMAAVVIAVGAMIAASGPLTKFVNAHPSLIVLCLGFLLMVGLVLVVDGLGHHIPKGYLYSAIGFSVLIESFNQLALRNRRRWAETVPLRQRAVDAVLRIIGGVPVLAPASQAVPGGADPLPDAMRPEVFTPTEREMLRGVLLLAERSVQSIMTPRADVTWIDAAAAKDAILAVVRGSTHRHFLMSRGTVDAIVGVARRADIVEFCLDQNAREFSSIARVPMTVHEDASILDTLRLFKQAPVEIAIVMDSYGVLQGIVTHTDVLEAIAGHLPASTQEEPEVRDLGDGLLSLDGAMAIHEAQARLGIELPAGQFHTLAGFVLFLFDRVPKVGDHVLWDGWRFEVAELAGMRVSKVLARRPASAHD